MPVHKRGFCPDGWTLIEALVVMLILSTLCFFTLVNLRNAHRRASIVLMEQSLQEAIEWAKARALLSHEILYLTHLPRQTDWAAGMILQTQTQECLHQWTWPASDVHVYWHGFLSSEGLLIADDVQHSAMNGFFLIASAASGSQKVVVNRVGRLKRVPVSYQHEH